jgi:hypothetical protein
MPLGQNVGLYITQLPKGNGIADISKRKYAASQVEAVLV